MKKYYVGIILLIVLAIGAWGLNRANPNRASSNITADKLPYPLERGAERPKLLTFGLFVSPELETNPIKPPEEFTGFHTALDIEILPGEENSIVEVKTVCTGDILYADTAEGYGGVIIQSCTIHGQPVSVLYGHIDPASFKVQKGTTGVSTGTVIANLGAHKTEQTGNTRKHLHLGIHKGIEIKMLGYVQTEAELQEYINPQPLLE